MESGSSTNHADQAEKLSPGSEATNSCCCTDESAALSSSHHNVVTSKRTSFLDLPGELRNEIYRLALRHDNIRNLKLKYRFTRNGSTYTNERLPPLYHALPQHRGEILSIYYSESKFRIHLWKGEHREIFRAWIDLRGKALDGLKHLELIFRRFCWHREIGSYSASAALLLTFDANGNLILPRVMPMLNLCTCWVIPLVEGAYKQSIAESQALHETPDPTGQETVTESSAPHPILNFALKLCSLRDLPREHQPNWSSLLHQLNEDKHKGLVPCWQFWESLWTILGFQ